MLQFAKFTDGTSAVNPTIKNLAAYIATNASRIVELEYTGDCDIKVALPNLILLINTEARVFEIPEAPKLQRLKLRDCVVKNNRKRKLPSLYDLCLANVNFENAGNFSFDNIESLSIEDCTIDWVDMNNIDLFKSVESLIRLRIIHEKFRYFYFDHVYPNIEFLVIQCTQFEPANLPNIERITINGQSIDTTFLNSFALKEIDLEDVELAEPEKLNTDNLTYIGLGDGTGNFAHDFILRSPRLKDLVCTVMDKISITRVINNCPEIETITVGRYEFSDIMLQKLDIIDGGNYISDIVMACKELSFQGRVINIKPMALQFV